MFFSAAKSHHVVSEPRLLISSHQDDPVGGIFDPNLPPIFDVYNEDVYNINKPDDDDENQVIHSETINKLVPECYVLRLTNKTENTVKWLVEIGCLESNWEFKEIGQNMIRGCGCFVEVKIAICLGMRVCIWNQQQSSMVFNPGIRQRRKEAIQIIAPALSMTLEGTRIGTILFEEMADDTNTDTGQWRDELHESRKSV